MPKTLIRLNYIHLQPGTAIFEEDLAAAEQPFAFVAYRRHSEDIKGEPSKIGLRFVAVIPELYNVKVIKLL